MRLYHLRRGPLLGTLLQHPDDIALAQAMFLTSPLESSLRQMMPVLYEFVRPTPEESLGDAAGVIALQVRRAHAATRECDDG